MQLGAVATAANCVCIAAYWWKYGAVVIRFFKQQGVFWSRAKKRQQKQKVSDGVTPEKRAELYADAYARLAQTAMGITCHAVAFYLLIRLILEVAGMRLTADGNFASNLLLAGIFLLNFTLHGRSPVRMSALNPGDVVGLASFLAICLAVCSITDPVLYASFAGPRSIHRVLSALLFTGVWKAAGANALLSVVTVCKLHALHATSNQNPTLSMLISGEILMTFSTVGVYVGARHLSRRTVDAQVEFRMLEVLNSSVDDMLTVLCDATVKLGPDLGIVAGGAKLAAMLMMSSGMQHGLKGRQFASLVHESDRVRVSEFVRGPAQSAHAYSEDSGLESTDEDGSSLSEGSGAPTLRPSSLHVRLQDSAGLPCPVQLFRVPIPDVLDPNGLPSHLIGIKDDSDMMSRASTVLDSPAPVQVQDAALTPPGSVPTRVLGYGPRSSSSRSARSSRSGSSAGGARQLEGIESVKVVFDAFSEELFCQDMHVHFKARDGSGHQADQQILRNWLGNWKEFQEFVEESVNRHLTDDPTEPDPIGFVDVCLPCHPDVRLRASSCSVAFVQDLNVESKDSEDGDSEEDQNSTLWAEVLLSGFHQQRTSRRRRAPPSDRDQGIGQHDAMGLASIQEGKPCS
eukprot:gb/GFBE01079317.1/.p1 GENE.gb/GFBE01079317.1/~~gb/GFBE01079317.1/.p1  ORF type:complete len:628 (+),score=90.69 gb/GFBE01079317.1/:1-1884(+)